MTKKNRLLPDEPAPAAAKIAEEAMADYTVDMDVDGTIHPIPPKDLGYPDVAANTMLGDLMKMAVEQLKVLPKPWQQLSEHDQRDFIYRIETQTRQAVQQAVNIIMSQGQVSVFGTVESVTFKDGVKAVVKLPRGADGAHDLADAEGAIVKIVIAQTDHFTSDANKPEAESDQRALNLNDDESYEFNGGDEGDESDLEELEAEGAHD